jgi:hypothetical protein
MLLMRVIAVVETIDKIFYRRWLRFHPLPYVYKDHFDKVRSEIQAKAASIVNTHMFCLNMALVKTQIRNGIMISTRTK